jgi:hypothetical protein
MGSKRFEKKTKVVALKTYKNQGYVFRKGNVNLTNIGVKKENLKPELREYVKTHTYEGKTYLLLPVEMTEYDYGEFAIIVDTYKPQPKRLQRFE